LPRIEKRGWHGSKLQYRNIKLVLFVVVVEGHAVQKMLHLQRFEEIIVIIVILYCQFKYVQVFVDKRQAIKTMSKTCFCIINFCLDT